jgi:hypothetical protein
MTHEDMAKLIASKLTREELVDLANLLDEDRDNDFCYYIQGEAQKVAPEIFGRGRVIVLLKSLNEFTNTVQARIPAWKPDNEITLFVEDLTSEVIALLEHNPGQEIKVYAWVNMDAESKKQLQLSDWEVE